MIYFSVLDEDARSAFIDAAEVNARKALSKLDARWEIEEAGEDWAMKAAILGARSETLARLSWLAQVRELVVRQ
jgi:hypothetical protein